MPNLIEPKVFQQVDSRKQKLRGKIGAELHSV